MYRMPYGFYYFKVQKRRFFESLRISLFFFSPMSFSVWKDWNFEMSTPEKKGSKKKKKSRNPRTMKKTKDKKGSEKKTSSFSTFSLNFFKIQIYLRVCICVCVFVLQLKSKLIFRFFFLALNSLRLPYLHLLVVLFAEENSKGWYLINTHTHTHTHWVS